MTVLLLAFLAHFIADFVMQTSTIVKQKNSLRFSGYLVHGSTYLILSIALLHTHQLDTVVIFSSIAAVLHVVIDYVKCRICKTGKKSIDLGGFCIDQALHLGVIFWLWQCFEWRPNPPIVSFYHHFLTPKTVAVFNQGVKASRFSWDHLLTAIIIYIVVGWGGAILIRKILNIIDKAADYDAQPQKAGYYIGLLERFIILTLVLFDGLGSIAFILTAKSIARFSELNNKKFAEYYLIGTLLSTVLAIGGGLLLKFVTTAV